MSSVHSPITIDLALLAYGSLYPNKSLMKMYDTKSQSELLALYEEIRKKVGGPEIAMHTKLFTSKALIQSLYDDSPSEKNYNGFEVVPLTYMGSGILINSGASEAISTVTTFKDSWVTRFSKNSVRPFTRSDGSIVQVTTMVDVTSMYEIYVDKDTKVVRKRFQNGAYAEFIMGDDKNYAYDLKLTNIILRVPKFITETSGDAKIYLPDDVASSIPKISHKTTVKFDEIGAEASSMVRISLNLSPIPAIVVDFDKTFHYRIIKNDTIIIRGTYDGV